MTASDQELNPPAHQPLDSAKTPRYAEVATFMRTPRVDDVSSVDIGIFGVPFDTATFRSGAREGPSAVREASRAIRRVNPSTELSPFDTANVADLGDVPVNILDFQGSLAATEAFVHRLSTNSVLPIAIGGDHTVTLPMLRGLRNYAPMGLLQIDSHPDTLDEFFGSRENHGTWARRGTEEGLIDAQRVVQLGLRGTRFGDELQYGDDAGFTVITYDKYEAMGRAAAIEQVKSVLDGGPIYITYDVDGLDPTEAPGTAAREPGGLSMRDSQVILRSLTGMNIVGADVSEVSPPLDHTGLTPLNAANLMFELTCLLAARAT